MEKKKIVIEKKIVDSAGLFNVLCQFVDKLNKNEIDSKQAYAMSKFVAQAKNLLDYELRKAIVTTNPYIAKNLVDIQDKKAIGSGASINIQL